MGNTQGNNGTGNVIERDDWETPQWLFNKLNKQYGFTYDCCATKDNNKCIFYDDNFLKDDTMVLDTSWMNPPFSKALKMFEHFFKVVEKGVCIYRCDNLETVLWQDIILKNATWVFIPNGRINYEGKKGKGSRFPSALIGYNVRPPMNIIGYTLIIKRSSL